MPRAQQIEYEGAAYHVMARGNRRQDIVFSDDDRMIFLADACKKRPKMAFSSLGKTTKGQALER